MGREVLNCDAHVDIWVDVYTNALCVMNAYVKRHSGSYMYLGTEAEYTNSRYKGDSM